jgi:hypothetical protein
MAGTSMSSELLHFAPTGRSSSVPVIPKFLTDLLESSEGAITAISNHLSSDEDLTPINRVRLVDLRSAYERVFEQLKSFIEASDNRQ